MIKENPVIDKRRKGATKQKKQRDGMKGKTGHNRETPIHRNGTSTMKGAPWMFKNKEGRRMRTGAIWKWYDSDKRWGIKEQTMKEKTESVHERNVPERRDRKDRWKARGSASPDRNTSGTRGQYWASRI